MVAALPTATFARLKPHVIDIRVSIDPVHWFLSPAKDTRSSLSLEDAATEFQLQGLELDWTTRHVGRRLALVGRRLELSQFSRGPRNSHQPDRREEARAAKDLKNPSLVLLTRGEAGDGDPRSTGGQTRQDAEPRVRRMRGFAGDVSSHRCGKCGVKIGW